MKFLFSLTNIKKLLFYIYIFLLFPLENFARIFGSDSQVKPLEFEQNYIKRKMVFHSFKAPFYLIRGTIPYWTYGGSTVITDEYIRLTPAEKSRSGWIWNLKPITFQNWEVEIDFKIGSQSSLGADGLAFWYTREYKQEGPVFGSKDKWTGLAVIFDTFDNDNQNDNPYIGIYLNDGSWSFQEDGKEKRLGGCRSHYRNYDTKVKITYVQENLQVQYKIKGVTAADQWLTCAVIQMSLTSGYYFGLSAATGGLTDNHDIYTFETYELISKNEASLEQFLSRDQIDNQFANEKSRLEQIRDNLNKIKNEAQSDISQNELQYQQTLQTSQQYQQPSQTSQQYQQPLQTSQQYQQPSQNSLQYQQPLQNSQQYQQPSQTSQQHQQTSQQYQQPLQTSEYSQSSEQINDNILGLLSHDIQFLKNRQNEFQLILSSLQNNIQQETEIINKFSENQKYLVQLIEKLISSSLTKDELKNLGINNPEIQTFSSQLQDIRQFVDNKLTKNFDEFRVKLDNFQINLQDIKSRIESTKEQQQSMEQNLIKNSNEISQNIQNSYSFGFWTYFICFQIIFGVSFMWWRKYRDENPKNLI
jgi:mannose-binding lectin 1